MALTDYLDEAEPAALVVIGLVLIVIPEPATTTLGAGVFLFGLAYMAYEWNRP
ncbi:hypothetical protein [Haloglomus salinum]|jgi:hypothetical protein|uniref:hypothetical protein n=1 Tax=Haloglomus salinum TaxID=2962673 RepID=UPI0020C9C510|nr:hypothetical protein [Haloglomus salinum]